MTAATRSEGRRRRRRVRAEAEAPRRRTDYRNLVNPVPPMAMFSDDRIEAIHAAALDILERLGIRVLLPEARRLFAGAGAIIDGETEMVRIGAEIVEAALASAPSSITARAAVRARDVILEQGRLIFQPGAPVCYGTFTSNVDMKSGTPAFGTPEHFKASLAAGQLARKIGLPWRCASGSAANVSDAQAAHETQFALWGCLLAGATVVIHAAGWLEGGLTVSYEKLITDIEVLQMVAELCAETPAGTDEIGFDSLAEIAPGGPFFAASQTMARYQTEFYEPLVADWSNFGTWTERGGTDAMTRATGIWQRILNEAPGPDVDTARVEALTDFIRRRSREGGAPPES